MSPVASAHEHIRHTGGWSEGESGEIGRIRPVEKMYVEEGAGLERAIYLQIVEQAQIIRKY